MKKIVMIVVVVISTTLSVNGQELIRYGVKLGYNLSSISGFENNVTNGEGITYASLSGYSIGGFAEISFTDELSVQPELLYSTKGNSSKYIFPSDVEGDLEGDIKLAYVDVSVLGKYYLTQDLSFELGPQLSFLTSAKYHTKGEIDGKEEDNSSNIREQSKSVDIGLNIGASYKFDFGLNLGLRYGIGFSDVLELYDNVKYTNRVFGLSTGYAF
ncbi:porin family protein [Flavicella marina]|uniref:porin family protein n=1 Tax=Flavicella marina TaxID=1475951 RepID=UPI001265622C|nr:porin family protein [Flavicella marina]